MNHGVYPITTLREQMHSLAAHASSGVWVDSNVLMYSSKPDKLKLLDFSELRTTPEVVMEVRKRPKEVSYFLAPFLEKAQVVGADSFEKSEAGKMFTQVSACCSSYSR